ncbi:MAG: hypothetical protein KBD25_00185 [Rickettsiaceae bacterium]|nr:hypothetical protein [Rickettsiaceae bacterium]
MFIILKNNQLLGYIGFPGDFGSLYLQSLGVYIAIGSENRYSAWLSLIFPELKDVSRAEFIINKTSPIIKPEITGKIKELSANVFAKNMLNPVMVRNNKRKAVIPFLVIVFLIITPSKIVSLYLISELDINKEEIPQVKTPIKAEAIKTISGTPISIVNNKILEKYMMQVRVEILFLIFLASLFNSSITINNNRSFKLI